MIKQIHIPSRLMLEVLEGELKSIETSHHTFDERGRLKSKIAFLEEKIYSAEAFLDVCLEQGFSVKASCAFQGGVMMLVLHKPDDSPTPDSEEKRQRRQDSFDARGRA